MLALVLNLCPCTTYSYHLRCTTHQSPDTLDTTRHNTYHHHRQSRPRPSSAARFPAITRHHCSPVAFETQDIEHRTRNRLVTRHSLILDLSPSPPSPSPPSSFDSTCDSRDARGRKYLYCSIVSRQELQSFQSPTLPAPFPQSGSARLRSSPALPLAVLAAAPSAREDTIYHSQQRGKPKSQAIRLSGKFTTTSHHTP